MVEVHVAYFMIAGLVLFTIGYFGYSKYLANRLYELDDSVETPAHKYQDGQEYVPAKKPVLLGHHWASISGAAPAVGPITAAFIWGWAPAFIWIVVGNPLFGAVHDFSALASSIRHEGKSIGFVIGEYVGERGKNLLLWFAFLLVILVIAAFAIVIAVVFNAYPQTATAGAVYIGLAVLFGIWLYQFNLSFVWGTVLFVAGVFAGVWLGIEYPIAIAEAGDWAGTGYIQLFDDPSFIPEILGSANIGGWVLVTLIYSFIASVLPVWLLLQPRDYISSFLMYIGIGGAILAVFVGWILGTSQEPLTVTGDISAWEGFTGGDFALIAMPLLPLLFLTIACGTISGFHSLVSSGTTSKQLDKETDAQLIGYGGMLMEGLFALVAMSTVLVVAVGAPGDGGIGLALPNFADGGGLILTSLGLPLLEATIFMALVLSAFVLTTMDTGVRIGRYLLEEAVGTPENQMQSYAANMYVSSGLIVVGGYVLVGSGEWETLWLLFGGSNQLLAALALLAATVWVASWDKSKQLISTGLPMLLMSAFTVIGLVWVASYQVVYLNLLDADWRAEATIREMVSSSAQVAIAIVLVILALMLLKIGISHIRDERPDGQWVATDGSGLPETDEEDTEYRHVRYD